MYAVVANCNFNGLSIIQELGRSGIEVLALDCMRSVGTFSKYADFIECPNPATHEHLFINFLIDYGKNKRDIGVIFPTNDDWAMAISKHRTYLQDHFRLVVSDFSTVELLLQKRRFYEWASARNFSVPKTWNVDNPILEFNDYFPLIAKPEYRRISGNEESSLSVSRYLDLNRLTIIRNVNELRFFKSKHQKFLDFFIAQEYISGLSNTMYTVGVYVDKSSNVRGLFSGRKVRGFPPSHGNCTLGQSEAVPQYILDEVESICKQLNYSGIAEFEYKLDFISKKFYLIEINPRSWSWIGITPKCDVSLASLAFLDLTDQPIPAYSRSSAADGEVKYVKLFQDFENCMWKNKVCGYPEWSFSLTAWLSSLGSKSLVIAEFQTDDLLVFVYSLWSFIGTRMKAILHKIMSNI